MTGDRRARLGRRACAQHEPGNIVLFLDALNSRTFSRFRIDNGSAGFFLSILSVGCSVTWLVGLIVLTLRFCSFSVVFPGVSSKANLIYGGVNVPDICIYLCTYLYTSKFFCFC